MTGRKAELNWRRSVVTASRTCHSAVISSDTNTFTGLSHEEMWNADGARSKREWDEILVK